MSGGPRLNFIGYQQTFGVSRQELKRHIDQLLTLQSGLSGMEPILVHEWQSAFASYLDANKRPASFGILGSEIKVESLQYVVALSIAYAGLLFLFAVTLRLDAITPQSGTDTLPRLSFPDYGRFQSTPPKLDFGTACMCTVLWWTFLWGPALLLSFGIVYRYVLPIGDSPIFSPLGLSMVARIPDEFSLACDLVNLVCLGICFVSMLMLENIKQQKTAPRFWFFVSAIASAASLFSLTRAYLVVSRSYGLDYGVQAFIIEILFISLWTFVTLYSSRRGMGGVWIVSVMFLASYTALGIDFSRQ